MNHIYCCLALDSEALGKAKRLNCNFIITNTIQVPMDEVPAGIEIVSALKHRVQGSWRSLEIVEKEVDEIKRFVPELFTYRGADLTTTFYKAMYWYQAREASWGNILVSLEVLQESIEGPIRISLAKQSSLINRTKALAKVLGKMLLSSFSAKKGASHVYFGKRGISFLYDQSNQLKVDEKFLESFDTKDISINYISGGESQIPQNIIQNYDVNKVEYSGKTNIPKINLFQAFKVDPEVLLRAVNTYSRLCEQVNWFLDASFDVLVLNAAENSVLATLLHELQKIRPFKTVNKMYGLKAPTANNAYARFDRWIVWDESMRHMLVKGCGLDENQFHVIGHPYADDIKCHQYSGSLPVDPVTLKGKKIITYIDVYDSRPEKIILLDTLYFHMQQNPDWVLLYRPKLSTATKSEVHLPPQELGISDQVIYIDYHSNNKKDTLYDQLLISNFTFCIGSTVALESYLMGTPVLTYESGQSLLYFVGEDMVIQAKTPVELKNFLNHMPWYLKSRKQAGQSVESILSRYISVVYNMQNDARKSTRGVGVI